MRSSILRQRVANERNYLRIFHRSLQCSIISTGCATTACLIIINEMLVAVTRLAEGRKMEPAAAIIDSQSVKTTEADSPRGYNAGKKIKGANAV